MAVTLIDVASLPVLVAAIVAVLGVGSTSTCHRCVSIETGVAYACKIIDKRNIEQRFRGLLSQFHVEIEVLKELQHPNIIRLEVSPYTRGRTHNARVTHSKRSRL